ncbi:MAG: hypothetical protein ACT4OH_03065, partial [Methylophilaceae bacterium]
MGNRLIRALVLFFALVMPFQAFSMVAGCALMSSAEHCKQMQQTQAQSLQTASVGDRCKMHDNNNSSQKEVPQKANCCSYGACAAICAGLVFPASVSFLHFDSI